MLTLHDVSPPVQSVHVGVWFGPVEVSSNRLIESQSRFARNAPVVTTTKYEPSGEMSRSRIYVANELEHHVVVPSGWYTG